MADRRSQVAEAAHRCRRRERAIKMRGARRQRLLRREAGAVRRRSLDIRRTQVTALDRPVGLRQVDLPALPQPHERHHRRLPGRPATIQLDGEDIYDPSVDVVQLRARVGMVFQKPNPFPEVDLRERRLRPAHPRPGRGQGRSRRDRRSEPASGAGLWNEVKDRLQRARHRPFRRPAAAAVHRARHRGQPGGDPDGRALLGARPDRHRAHRGADRRAAAELHDRHRHPLDAAGGARVAAHRLLPPRQADRGGRRPTRSSPTRASKRTQDYITGRFG